jgi:RNA polymerase sigma-70 factor, ECF subfamily
LSPCKIVVTFGSAGCFRPRDNTLVAKPTSEGQREFAGFMRAYQDMVYSTAARLTGNPAQAEDIAQEVFLKAFENFAQLRSSTTAGGWLKTVATNLTLNHLSRYRKRWRFFSELRREDDGDEPEEIDFPVPDTLLKDVEASQRHELIEESLQKLPEHQRVPLVLYHFQDMAYDEIAAQLHVSLSKVKVDIMRARGALAKLLAHRGVENVAEEN